MSFLDRAGRLAPAKVLVVLLSLALVGCADVPERRLLAPTRPTTNLLKGGLDASRRLLQEMSAQVDTFEATRDIDKGAAADLRSQIAGLERALESDDKTIVDSIDALVAYIGENSGIGGKHPAISAAAESWLSPIVFDFGRVCCFLDNHAPVATLIAPHDRAMFSARDAIIFKGRGDDFEEGHLYGTRLMWSSNIDGPIGWDTAFRRTLSVGAHIISLRAMDQHGWYNIASVVIYVGVQPIEMDTAQTASGLMLTVPARLASNPSGATITVTSSNPGLVVVSPDLTTPGTATTTVSVPAGQLFANFVVAGLEGQTGTATVTLSGPGFAGVPTQIRVVQPAVGIAALPSNISVHTPDQPFELHIGLPGTSIGLLPIRAGAPPTTVTVTSSAPAIGVLSTSASTGAAVTVQFQPGQERVGGIRFLPRAVGSTTVNAASPGFVQTPVASQVVTVTP